MSANLPTGDPRPVPQHVCPNCGYCPCCGRSRHTMPYYPYPYLPNTTPWVPLWPGITWTVSGGESGATGIVS